MAASRFGFYNLYKPLNECGSFDTSLRDGTIAELSFLANIISPLVKARKNENDFEVSKIVRKHSPLLDKKSLAKTSDQIKVLDNVENAVEDLLKLWKYNTVPTCLEILKSVRDTNLFKLDNRVDDILSGTVEASEDKKVMALKAALSVSFDELERYSSYVKGETRFATHQGIKGLEFPRVMVIMDDTESKGFLFSYEKLFGAKEKTDADIRNEREGNDTSVMRTTRLFYVACTRTEKSLAVVAYTENADAVKKTAILKGWFAEEEIKLIRLVLIVYV